MSHRAIESKINFGNKQRKKHAKFPSNAVVIIHLYWPLILLSHSRISLAQRRGWHKWRWSDGACACDWPAIAVVRPSSVQYCAPSYSSHRRLRSCLSRFRRMALSARCPFCGHGQHWPWSSSVRPYNSHRISFLSIVAEPLWLNGPAIGTREKSHSNRCARR